jgi:Domain of unknown function (DUF4157)
MSGMLQRPAAHVQPVTVPALVRRPLIGLSSDPAEREAEGIADRLLVRGVAPLAPAINGPGGHPLLSAERAVFEPAFGQDFSRVRVYEDSAARESADALDAAAYTIGQHIVLGTRPAAEHTRVLAHELAHVVQADRAVAAPVVRRVSFGTDGLLSPQRQAVVTDAARIAGRLVTTPEFARKWNAFWAGPFKLATPRPNLETYRAAVRERVVHDMDTSALTAVRKVVEEERDMPLERQTGAVTQVGSKDSYLRQFVVDQGVDAVVSLLLHESFHGAGVPMGGNVMAYEPVMHWFEAEAGFPMVMGGADILNVKQVRRSDYDVDVTVKYALRRIDEPLPEEIEIQAVSKESGEVIMQEEPNGRRRPVRHRLVRREGSGFWVWHAHYVGIAPVTIRIVDLTTGTLMASRPFEPNPRCVLGVSTVHCEEG